MDLDEQMNEVHSLPASNGKAARSSFDGVLHSQLHLVLQTRQAQLLVRGRAEENKPLIVGLLGFADRMRLIWQAAEEDDPFADWFLLQVHDAMSVAEARIAAEIRQLKLQLRGTRTLEIAPAAVKEPFRMALRFSTPYPYRAARMLGDFDEMACCAFTARQIGELNDEHCANLVRGCARRVRAVFSTPSRFRRLGVMRSAAVEQQTIFKRAEELMGAIPKDVLDCSRRAPLVPQIKGAGAQPLPPVSAAGTFDSMVFD